MDGMAAPPPVFIISASSTEEPPAAANEKDDIDDCIRVVLSRLTSSLSFSSFSLSRCNSPFSFRKRSFSRLDNVGCDGELSLDHSDEGLVVEVVVVLSAKDGHEGKVRNMDKKEVDERGWGAVSLGGSSLLLVMVLLLIFLNLSLLVRYESCDSNNIQ